MRSLRWLLSSGDALYNPTFTQVPGFAFGFEGEQPIDSTPVRSESLHTGIAVGLGAALGALARYALTLLTTDGSPQAVVMILAINMAGCFAMGLLKPGPFWGMGFLGGFTTYSAVALGALDFSLGGAVIFIVVTFIACVASWLAGDAASGGARRA